MASVANSFSGPTVPEAPDRRELYKSQYRAIYTYKMSAAELDQAFREAVTGEGPDGGWSIKNDERVKYVGKLNLTYEKQGTALQASHVALPQCSCSQRVATVILAQRKAHDVRRAEDAHKLRVLRHHQPVVLVAQHRARRLLDRR